MLELIFAVLQKKLQQIIDFKFVHGKTCSQLINFEL